MAWRTRLERGHFSSQRHTHHTLTFLSQQGTKEWKKEDERGLRNAVTGPECNVMAQPREGPWQRCPVEQSSPDL